MASWQNTVSKSEAKPDCTPLHEIDVTQHTRTQKKNWDNQMTRACSSVAFPSLAKIERYESHYSIYRLRIIVFLPTNNWGFLPSSQYNFLYFIPNFSRFFFTCSFYFILVNTVIHRYVTGLFSPSKYVFWLVYCNFSVFFSRLCLDLPATVIKSCYSGIFSLRGFTCAGFTCSTLKIIII